MPFDLHSKAIGALFFILRRGHCHVKLAENVRLVFILDLSLVYAQINELISPIHLTRCSDINV